MNLMCSEHSSPAHCGAAKGQIETVKLLGRHRANLWLRNVKGDQPLHEAVQSGRKELVRSVGDHGSGHSVGVRPD